jgi:serine protease inhibitor
MPTRRARVRTLTRLHRRSRAGAAEHLQKAYIGVSERETIAAAATAVVAATGSAPQQLPLFYVDRPFLFFIRDESGAVLFSGQVVDPTAP